MCPHNKRNCLAIRPAIWTTRHWLLHIQSITGDNLHSCSSNSHVEVGQCFVLLENKVVQILFRLVQKPYGKHVCARVTHDGVPTEIKGSWILSFEIAQNTLFWWISFKIEGGNTICCSSNTDVMPIHFAVDVKSRHFTNNKPSRQVVVSNSVYVPVAKSYHTATSSVSQSGPTEVGKVS